MRRAMLMLAALTVLTLVVTMAGCSGGDGAPDGATMDTAVKPPPPPPPDPTPCKLICTKYTSYKPLTTGLFTMNTDGSDVQMLDLPHARVGCWAPDGQRVVFTCDSWLHTSLPDGTDLAQFTTGSEPELEGTSLDTYPDWSPDGSSIVFQRRTGDYTPAGYAEHVICVKRLDGTALQLTSGYQDRWPSWSPDGDYLVFHRTADSWTERGLYAILAAEGATPVALVAEGETTPLGGAAPDWGRDAEKQLRVLFSGSDLCSVPVHADGTVAGPVHTYPGTEHWMFYPSWSPEGTQFAFHSESTKGGKYYFSTYIYTVAADSYVKIGDGGFPAWSPPIFGGS